MRGISLVVAALAAVPCIAGAQSRKLKIVGSDSVPVVYAFVSIEGATGQISDDKGEVSLGKGKKQTVTANVRRIGYGPFFGKIDLPDTASTITIVLPRLAQELGAVNVIGKASAPPTLRTFYDRWEMRQKGLLSATFIGPEEIEFRHPDKITNMLNGLNGVSFRRTDNGGQVAFGYNGQCQMAVLVDGIRQCPGSGCKSADAGANIVQIGQLNKGPPLSDMTAVVIDRLLDANDVAAIEGYARGGNMPVSLQVADNACGVIAFWTGSRK